MSTGALAAIAAAASVVKGIAGVEAGEAQARAFRLQAQQARITANQQAIQRLDKLDTIISSQNAAIGKSGFAPSSGSFSAIQTSDFNNFARDQRLADLQTSITQSSLESQASSAESVGFLNFLGSLVGAGVSAVGAFKGGGGVFTSKGSAFDPNAQGSLVNKLFSQKATGFGTPSLARFDEEGF